MFSLFVTHIWTKFFSQMLNRDICLNVQLLHSFLLQRTPILNSSFLVIYFELYVFIGVNLKCCCRTNFPFFSLKRIIEAFYGSAVFSNLCFFKKKYKFPVIVFVILRTRSSGDSYTDSFFRLIKNSPTMEIASMFYYL